MRTRFAIGILGLCALAQGCGPITLATRTLVTEPVHYCTTKDNISEWHRNYKLAETAWAEIEKAHRGHVRGADCNHGFSYGRGDYLNPSETVESPPPRYSADYAKGFKDGFADYLYAGGTGEPPPLPPRHYWKMRYETPEGHRAMEDWFAGFRHGAGVAQASGYREWVTLPSSLPPADVPGQHTTTLLKSEGTGAPPSEMMLPPPRPVLPPQGGPASPPSVPREPPSEPSRPLPPGPVPPH